MKYNFIARHQQKYPVKTLCRVLEVSVNGYCAWKRLCWLLRTSVHKIGGLLQFDLFPLSLPSRRERCTCSENREQANQCSAKSDAHTSATKQRYEAFSSFSRMETGQVKQNHSIPLVRPPIPLGLLHSPFMNMPSKIYAALW